MADNQTYLGDGVYASHDGYGVWIWTSDGVRQSEKIFLEPSTLAALVAFAQPPRAQFRPAETQSVFDPEARVHRTLMEGEQ